ncbi:hypothetical protein SEA_FORZA_70 [Gordonia phage Forza]|uniref:Uncharacterized protein n=1 Tax=Gordonia phage Forza TaxID=2571247 RepID=A0A650EYA0_9CAUD|nr:hypothetical protein PP303_gp070 [Gordonia phage Forza]QEM41539.1 hypothetical protein SEA_BOOPY_70 [Gordonia phage Boopy]QGT55063.1 hypothetical protein SEA_FORZA_70 [Gordonia phage Forza]UXE04212.1 hypothetical protein SEA_BLUENGOLD_68 [Gordonia phage BlueNGold]WBF03851.1 hypothetical protein SEA_MAREELIH_68 [Gordonia phage Mareelih]
MTDVIDDVDVAGIPNLTKINWNQPLVASIRLAIYGDQLPVAYPVDPDTLEPFNDDKLKSLVKSSSAFSDIKAECFVLDRVVQYAPKPKDEWTEINLFMDVVRAANAFRHKTGDLPRAGAILATILTELGWPVHLVLKALNTSRPTISRWIFMQQDETLSDSEIDAINECFVSGEFSYLFDFRTLAFRTKRTGLVFKKAVFLPNLSVYHFMQALWRVAYRTRGDKSGYQESACSATLDIMIELLLRRGATALNIGKILGIQHMAVIQRNRKARDVFGQIETTMDSETYGSYFENESDLHQLILDNAPKSNDLSRILEYTRHEFRSFASEDETDMKAYLLQVRTSKPTASHPIPLPNISVLSAKPTADALDSLKNLDLLPGYAVNSYLDSMSQRYAPAIPNLYRKNQDSLISYFQEVTDPPKSLHPLVNWSIGIRGFDGVRYHYPSVTRPDQWRVGRLLTEHMLLQATMQYDRDKHGLGFGKTTYHWLPDEAWSLVGVSDEDNGKEWIEHLLSTPPEEEGKNDTQVKAIRMFFPKHHLDLIDLWLKESKDKMLIDKTPGESLLWKCLHRPADILKEYPAPVARGSHGTR